MALTILKGYYLLCEELRAKYALIDAQQYSSFEKTKTGIFEYIEIFYHRLSRHAALGYVSLAEFERKSA